MEETVYLPAPRRPGPCLLVRHGRVVLPEGRTQSTPTVGAEIRSRLSQGTQHSPHAPKKRHCTRRQGSDGHNLVELPGTTEPPQQRLQPEPAFSPPELGSIHPAREALWETCELPVGSRGRGMAGLAQAP